MGWKRSVWMAVCLTAAAFGASSSQEEDPWRGTQVLVEAFRMEVKTAALQEAGVSVIGQSPEGISIPALLWSLRDESNGRVSAGIKASASQRSESQSEQKQTRYVKRSQIVQRGGGQTFEDVKWEPYQESKSFNVSCYLLDAETIYVRGGYQETYFEAPEGDEAANDGPPDHGSFTWQGSVYVKNGAPMIIAGVQDGEMTELLVLTATIQQRPGETAEAVETEGGEEG